VTYGPAREDGGIRIAPSILSADFATLADDVASVRTEADLLHVDIMDAHFVPALTIGPPVVASLRKHTDLFLDCHLMVDDPEVLLTALAEAGADGCSVHIELGDPWALIERIHSLGMQAGLVVNPETPVERVLPWLDRVELLLVMSVHPGAGGQAFIPDVLPKLAEARRWANERGLAVDLQIDGGINEATAGEAVKAGADILVAGSAIFAAEDPLESARRIRAAAQAPTR
jgi:ribulose-phosphate 3-epimerase